MRIMALKTTLKSHNNAKIERTNDMGNDEKFSVSFSVIYNYKDITFLNNNAM